MNNIISQTKALLLLAIVIIMASCSGDEVEIIEQDTSWKIDDKYITEDIREQLGIDPFSNLLFFERVSELVLDATTDLQSTVIEQGNDFKLKVRITKPFEKDLNLRIVTVDSLLERYPGGAGKFLPFPDKSFSSEAQVLNAGESEVEFVITLRELNALNRAPGYILPLQLEVMDKVDHIKPAKMRGCFFVKINLSLGIENIADSYDVEIEGETFNSAQELSFESNVTSRLSALNDGLFTGSWYPQNQYSYLLIKLAKKETVKGIKCHVKTGTYNLKKVRISANLPEGDDFIQGIFKVPEDVNQSVYWIKFKKTISTDQIKMDMFSGKNGVKDPDFTEIYLVK